MSRLALTMIVKNEAAILDRCLRSVKDVCDELIIVDTGSVDRTIEIARQWGAQVYEIPWEDDFSAARNFALSQSDCEWNLVLDADEFVEADCIADLISFLSASPCIGSVQILSRVLEEGEEKVVQNRIPRLLPRGVTFQGRIHEQVVSDLPRRFTGIRVLHDGYWQTSKFERNVPLLLKELEQRPTDPYLFKHLAKEHRVAGKFAEADAFYASTYQTATGNEGFFATFVVDYLYHLKNRSQLELAVQILAEQKDRMQDYPDFQFVMGLILMDLIEKTGQIELLPLIEQSFQNCLLLGEHSKYDSVVGTGSYYAAYNLGVFYEVTGNDEAARTCYGQAADWGYARAKERLKLIENCTRR